MKTTNPIHQLSALICVICGLTLLPLTASAKNLLVSGTAYPAESDAIYESAGVLQPALYVFGSSAFGTEGSYTGTNITLINDLSIFTALITNNGRLELTGGSVITTDEGSYGISLDNSSSAIVSDVNFETETTGLGISVTVLSSSTLVLTGGSITGGFMGIMASDSSISVGNVHIESATADSVGLILGSSTLSLADSTVIGNFAGVMLDSSSSGTLNNVNITVTGEGSNALYLADNSTATVNLDGNTLTGGLHSGSNSALILTGSNGTLLTGDITSTDNSTVNLTLTDENSKLIGNITQDATSAITLDISDGASFVGSGTVTSLTLENGVTIGYTGDLITVTDSILIDGVVTFDLSDLSEAGNYDLIDWSGAGGNVDVGGADYNFTGAGVEGTFNVVGDKLVFNATAIPEPATCFLLGTSLGLLLLAAHRRRNAQS